MTQEDKEFLLRDLCARLPYGVKVNNEIQGDFVIYGVCENYIFARTTTSHVDFRVEDIKPYLFPLSSMTEGQCYKLASIRSGFQDCWKYIKTPIPLSICNFENVDWFNKNHFDYRGLIEKGLAIDATGLNIY